MVKLLDSLAAWGGPRFEAVFKDELRTKCVGRLPLQAGTCRGGWVDDTALSATVLRCRDGGDGIEVLAGVFFQEVEMACSCGDEPQATPAYCEVRVWIDKGDGQARFAVVDGAR